MKRILILVLLISNSVWAQPRHFVPMDIPLPVEGNQVFGLACAFPAKLAASLKYAEDTGLSYVITADRTISDVTVERSSGYPDLDEAAIRCVSAWRVDNGLTGKPALFPADPSKLGSGTHRLHVLWSKACGIGEALPRAWCGTPGPITTGPKALGSHDCGGQYPQQEFEQGIEGTTLVIFHITVDGHVVNPNVERTSGNDNLDKAAVACVTTWLFQPANWDGIPFQMRFGAMIVWKKDAPHQ